MTEPQLVSFRQLDLQHALQVSLDIEDFPVIADFRTLEWVEPFSMLYIASILRGRSDTVVIQPSFDSGNSYATYMGFFEAVLGSEAPSVRSNTCNSGRYSPITFLDVKQVVQTAKQSHRDPAELLTNRASNLAAILTQQATGPINNTVTYAIRELLRNVLDHSDSKQCWYCAQAWPEKRMVEVAILDQGKGVLESLKRNPVLNINTDEEALKLALLPGITGTKPARNHGYFTNSGYGLYVTKQLCARGRGSFFVCSMRSGILVEAKQSRSLATRFAGTAIRMKLDLDVINQRPGLIEEIVSEGEQEAKNARDPRTMQASPASRGLKASEFS